MRVKSAEFARGEIGKVEKKQNKISIFQKSGV